MNDLLMQPQIAAERLICLMVVGARCYFEGDITQPSGSDIDPDKSVSLLEAWLRQENLWGKLSTKESIMMSKPPGNWTGRERISLGWRSESAGIIAWGLGLLEMRPYDTQFRPGHIMDVVPERGQPTGTWITAARFRAIQEIQEERDRAELWLWRARVEQNRKTNPGFEPVPGKTYGQLIAESACNGQMDGWFRMIENDYPAKGKPYARLTESEYQIMHSIAWERLYGLNWICDEEKDWDKVQTDT